MRKRVGIVALLQESNTFVSRRTTLADFQQDVLLTGEGIREHFTNAHHEVGGFLKGLDAAGIEAAPLLAARALPGGVMTAEAFDRLLELLQDELNRAGPLDGLLVAPHGATVSEQIADVDGHWLQMLRSWVGPDCPILGTMDPHANLSPAMVGACDGLTAYRTNPHVDQRERGLEAARLMSRTLRGEIRPVQAAAFPPLAINIECQTPDAPPCLAIYQAAEAVRSHPKVLSSSICLGFPYADVAEMGAATLVVADGDQRLADQCSAELGALLWSQRESFVPELTGVDAALDLVERWSAAGQLDGPVCLLEMGDNVGGGGPADSTVLATAIHRRRLRGAFVCLYDPEAVAQVISVRPDKQMSLQVGAKADALHGRPLPLEVTLRGVYDGKFAEDRPRHGGISRFDQGATAVVETAHGLTVMLTSKRMAPWSLAQLRSCELEPAIFHILVAKGVHSPLAAYREVCKRFIRVNTPGVTSADLSRFAYARRRRPMYPFEPDATWDSGHAFARMQADRL